MAERPDQKVERASAALSKPAGPSPKFATLEAVQRHHLEFVVECHKTWKYWHEQAVHDILIWDGFLMREKTHPIGLDAAEFGKYNRALWRRVNDAIVWSIFGVNRHVVKRLCFYRPRTFLTESNPDSAMNAVEMLNHDPLSIALWTDATSCVDVGDLLFVEDGRTPRPRFIELKEGTVNREIMDMLELEGAEFETKFQDFTRRREKAGVAQFNRVLRQKRSAEQAFELLKNDRGIDPTTGQEIKVVAVDVDEENYDLEFNAILVKAHDESAEVMELVGGCLWIYANGNSEVHRHQAAQRFQKMLGDRGVRTRAGDRSAVRSNDRDRMVVFNWNVYQPMAKPVFPRRIEPRVIASALCGNLMSKVFLYLDLDRFAQIVEELGARFVWGTDKAARRAKSMPQWIRPPLFGGRVPEIRVGSVRAFVTDPSLVQMYFDGVLPRTNISKTIAAAKLTEQSAGDP